MAKKVKDKFCSDCKYFERDTEGISFNADSKEYFMGVCRLGLTPDSPIKQFANLIRACDKHIPI